MSETENRTTIYCSGSIANYIMVYVNRYFRTFYETIINEAPRSIRFGRDRTGARLVMVRPEPRGRGEALVENGVEKSGKRLGAVGAVGIGRPRRRPGPIE